MRLTINQNILLKNIHTSALLRLFKALYEVGLADTGSYSVADITACPGTDTCNLAISNSTHISIALEQVIRDEYPELIHNKDIQIKISGCMNACGQHSLAQIGFHGSSFKIGNSVVPAVQVLLGGGNLHDGNGRISEKIIKVASKRAPDVLRYIFDDLEENSTEQELFNDYYDSKGKDYFYQLLKPLADNTSLLDQDYVDWGATEKFQTAIGVGECAGVLIDLVATLLYESQEKIDLAEEAINDHRYSDAIYHNYAAFINAAKGLLLDKEVHTNTQIGILNDFDTQFDVQKDFNLVTTFSELVLQINKSEPSAEFAISYLHQAKAFLEKAVIFRSITTQKYN